MLVLYNDANDPRPQMIPRPEMIPKLDRKWSRRKTRNGMELLFIYFSASNHNLTKRKEKILTT